MRFFFFVYKFFARDLRKQTNCIHSCIISFFRVSCYLFVVNGIYSEQLEIAVYIYVYIYTFSLPLSLFSFIATTYLFSAVLCIK